MENINIKLKILQKSIFILLTTLFGFLLFTSTIQAQNSNLKFEITGNVNQYNFEQCQGFGDQIYLLYKGEKVQTKFLANDPFQENPLKKIGRFSFFINLPLKTFKLEDYQIITQEGEKYNLAQYTSKIRYINNQVVLLPEIQLFCNKDKIDKLIAESYTESKKDKNFLLEGHGIEPFIDKEVKISKLTFISGDGIQNLENISLKLINKKTKEIDFERNGISLPLITSNKEVLQYIIGNSYLLEVEKKGYRKLRKDINFINGDNIIGINLDKLPSLNNLQEISQENYINNNQETNLIKEDVINGTGNSIKDEFNLKDQGYIDSKEYIKINLINKKKNSKYQIIINGYEIKESVNVLKKTIGKLEDGKQAKIEIFEDNKLIKIDFLNKNNKTIDIQKDFGYILLSFLIEWGTFIFGGLILLVILIRNFLLKK